MTTSDDGAPGADFAARRRAAVAGHTGDIDTALELAHHHDPSVRATALTALERSGAIDEATVRVALTDPAPSVRVRALTLAARRPGIDLLDSLDDPDDAVAEVAAWACGEQEVVSDAVLIRLCEMGTDHLDALVREAAVAALGAIGDERGLATVLAACSDKPAVRRRAVLALAPFDGDAVDAALDKALTDRDKQVRQAAEDVIGR